ncbi:MAG TPA: hypothetical protein VHK24_09065 [Steroidobacter sp.]|jgi:hypothetical protein|nr:hypothetical protein [Steroidobacter sp.]
MDLALHIRLNAALLLTTAIGACGVFTSGAPAAAPPPQRNVQADAPNCEEPAREQQARCERKAAASSDEQPDHKKTEAQPSSEQTWQTSEAEADSDAAGPQPAQQRTPVQAREPADSPHETELQRKEDREESDDETDTLGPPPQE